MSHSTIIKLIADQFIVINGVEVNIHDITAIVINSTGQIIEIYQCMENKKPEDKGELREVEE